MENLTPDQTAAVEQIQQAVHNAFAETGDIGKALLTHETARRVADLSHRQIRQLPILTSQITVDVVPQEDSDHGRPQHRPPRLSDASLP